MQIAIDFDETIFHTQYPRVIKPLKNAIETIKELHAKGHILTLWTCREDEHLEMAKQALKKHNILQYFSYFNENSKEKLAIWSDSRKLGADYFIDDKAGFTSWNKIRCKFKLEKSLIKRIFYNFF